MKKYFLKPNVAVNPLINQWYVPLPMINPILYAMLLTYRQIPIMESYINHPELHQEAAKLPEMLGASFMNYSQDRSIDIDNLLKKIIADHTKIIALANEVRILEQLLKKQAKGASLEALYSCIPNSLKGYVELVYDINANPSIRFIEGLLYRSPYFAKQAQSINLSVVNADFRPFILSTPILGDTSNWQINLPFSASQFDRLFASNHTPLSEDEAVEVLNLPDKSGASIENYFSLQGNYQPINNTYLGGAVRVRYFGHASLLIQTKNLSILVDPLLSYEYQTPLERFTYQDLPQHLDYILITHAHLDHMVIESLLQLRHKTSKIIVPKSGNGSIIDPSLKLMLNNLGFNNVFEIDELEEISLIDGRIISIPFIGEHHDLNIKGKTIYLLQLLDRSLLIAADTNNFYPEVYEHIHQLFDNIDTLFISMECDGAPLSWFYGHLLNEPIKKEDDLSRRGSSSNCQRAMQLINCIQAKNVYIYAMGLEPWVTYILTLNCDDESIQIKESNQLIKQCQQSGIYAERLYLKKEIFL